MDKAKSTVALCRTAFESEAAMDDPGHSMVADESLSGSFANMRLRYLLDSGDWTGEIAGWTMPKNAGPGARLDFAFARAVGEIMQGHRAAARPALAELEAVGHDVADIETKSGASDPSYLVRPEIFILEVRTLLAEQEGEFAGAERLLRQAVGLEEKLPMAFGPPTIDKPTHELLGEFLLRRGRKDEAHAEFERALARTPGRRLAKQGFEATSGSKPSRELR